MRSLSKSIRRLTNNLEQGNYNLTPLQSEIASQRLERVKSQSGYIGLRSWIEEKHEDNTLIAIYGAKFV